MDVITHRQMRNDSAEILRRVGAGETLIVTNHGKPAAMIVPATRNVLADLAASGQLRPATRSLVSLKEIQRRPAARSSAAIIDDTRGTW
jgi:prevent-host-death family protein